MNNARTDTHVICPLSLLTKLNTTDEIGIFTLKRLHTAVAHIFSISSAILFLLVQTLLFWLLPEKY